MQPLSDRLPLRSTTVWGRFENARAIPWIYGRCRLSPIRYNVMGTQFVIADHSIEGVDTVLRGESEIGTEAYAFRNTTDSTGHAVALIELGTPLGEGESLVLSVRGKRSTLSGALIENPSDILYDLLAELARRSIAPGELDQFRFECEQGSIRLGGAVLDASRTIRAQIAEILESVGAVWSGGIPGIARLYPGSERPAVVLDPTEIELSSTQLDTASLVTVLRVLYDYDYAAGKHRRALQFEAPDAIERYGRIEKELNAGWLHAPRMAYRLGERILRYQARPRWSASFEIPWQRHALIPGWDLVLEHPWLPLTPRWLISDVQTAPEQARITVSADAVTGSEPRIVLTTLATAFEPVIPSGIAVAYRDGVATITIVDDEGAPLDGAEVTIDNDVTRTTDRQGRVQFSIARGRHTLYITALGFAPQEAEFVI